MEENKLMKEVNLNLVGLINFTIKIVITSIIFIISVSIIIPELPKIRENERNKLILLGFIQNPYVLSSLAEYEEKKGNNVKAEKLIEAAIGLLEMNGALKRISLNMN